MKAAPKGTVLRYAVQFGAALQKLFDNPPYKSSYLQGEHQWTPKLFSHAVGVSENAVGQWRRGDSLPTRNMSAVVRRLFGPDPSKFAPQIAELWEIFRSCEQIKKVKNGRSHNIKEPSHTNTRPLQISRPPPIPQLSPYFMGREAERDGILNELLSEDHSSAFLIQGGPGVGKTELTKAVALHQRVVERFGERRLFVSLETSTTAEAMQDAITRALGHDPAHGFKTVLSILREDQTLLILDNLETPLERVEGQQAVEATLAELCAIEGVFIVASIRGNQSIRGTRWIKHRLQEFSQGNSIDLFSSIAGEWTRGDPDVDDLIGALGGIPLAINLVARRAEARDSLAPLWRRWQEIGSDLAQDESLPRSHLTSLACSIELSLESQVLKRTPGAIRLFRFLGCLPAGLSVQDCNILLGKDAFDVQEALCQVGIGREIRDRIDLLPPIRDHAARHHSPINSDNKLWSDHFLQLVRELGRLLEGTYIDGVLTRLQNEFSNIEAALRAKLFSGQRLEVMGALTGFARLVYLGSEFTSLFHDIEIACNVEGDENGEAECVRHIGYMEGERSGFETARAELERAIKKYQKLGKKARVADCTEHLGRLEINQSDYGAARAIAKKALSLARRAGDKQIEANCMQLLADADFHEEDYKLALPAYERACTLFQKIDDILGEANCLKRMGEILFARCEYRPSRRKLEQALYIYKRIGLVLNQAECIYCLANIALRNGRHLVAEEYYKQALSLFENTSNILREADCIKGLGDVAHGRDDYDAATVLFDKAQRSYVVQGNVLGEANCVMRRGEIALDKLDYHAAEQYFLDALVLCKKVNYKQGIANCIKASGDIALARRLYGSGRAAYEEALPLFEQIDDVLGQANCLRGIGELEFAQDLPGLGASLYLKAEPLFKFLNRDADRHSCIQKLDEIRDRLKLSIE